MNHGKTGARQNLHRRVRWVVLGLVTVLLAVVAFLHQHPLPGWTPPGVDALCPFGGLESLWSLMSTGDVMTKVAASSFILLVASVGVTILFRRAFCGQLCPLGALQEASAGVGKRIFHRRFQLPRMVDRPLRWLKYGVLAGVTGLTWIAGTLIIRPYDPWVAFMHLSSEELWTGFGVGLLVLVGSLVASAFYPRFFCKYLCPMGALYGLVSKVGVYRVRRNVASCIGCGKCDKVCPVDLPVSQGIDVTSAECLTCGLCVNACPAEGALEFAGPKKGRISPLFLTLATVGVFTAVIVATAVPGWFEVGKKSLGETVQIVQKTELGTSGVLDPDLIKGRNTLGEVAALTGIPRADFQQRFRVPEEAFDRPLKDLTSDLGFTVGEVRSFVAEKLGIADYVDAEKKGE